MEYENDYEQSYKAWLDFKESSNNSYRYIVSGYTWTGTHWETMLTIQNGEVTERAFHFKNFDTVLMPADGWDLATAQQVVDTLMAHGVHLEGTIKAEEFLKKLSWIESKQELNNTTDSPAAATLTLDQVYELAKNDWLRRRDNAKASFEAENNGIISSCGYWEDGCMDDCFRGIRITLVEGYNCF
ncbi:hypothetical protein RYH73_22645 [Olivibacter sp. CPCC 100613]|uniref:hypothetical protein n=1 Tax=Olivibacter sp. CPCC 100613 TaxID=3079931 RepID=UPI002FFB7B0D